MTYLLRELKGQEEKLLHCVHCGFCLPACPTYTRLGDEGDSPRGRLHLMRAVVEGRLDAGAPAFHRHLDGCLGCRACESVCPSGVEYGRLLEGAREVQAQARRPGLLSRLLLLAMGRRAVRRPVLALTRVLRATGIPGIGTRLLPERSVLGQVRVGLGMIAATRSPEVLSRGRGVHRGASAVRPAGTLGAGARTGVFLGCVQEGLLGRVNGATRRVLEANGFAPTEVPEQGCCGAVHAHTGDLEGARRLARRNIRSFERADLVWVAVNAAGCGAVMKEYPHLLAGDQEYAERARDMARRVRDISELLGREGLVEGGDLPLDVAYDAPCHLLHAQRVSEEPLTLLSSIPGLTVVPLEGGDECCGGSGIYGITHPDLGGRIAGDKVDSILATGVRVVATGNPGCMMQIGAGLRMRGARVSVVHPVELVDESYRRGGVYG